MSYGFRFTSVDEIQVPDVMGERAHAIFDDCGLAFLLGFRNKVLWYVITQKKEQYHVYYIPKKNGQKRIIHAPSPLMKVMLRQFHTKILVPLQRDLGEHVTAYRRGISTRMAVSAHVPQCSICDALPVSETAPTHKCPRKGTYINLDLRDFFHSTRRSWIRRYFNEVIGYNHFVSDLMANLLTVSDIPNRRYGTTHQREDEKQFYSGVPQGSPASGAICNLIADWILDRPILDYLDELNIQMGLAGEWRWTYTRYADDLAFTCGENLPLTEKRKIVAKLMNICHRAGYAVNKRKTRISSSYYRKQLLGIVFNRHPNIPREEYISLRSLTYNCLAHGFDTQYLRAGKESPAQLQDWLRGKVNYAMQVNPERGARLRENFDAAMKMWEHDSQIASVQIA